MPSYMALYKTNMLYENEAYVLVADKRAKFSVLSNGYKFLTTLPEFYQQDPTATVIINGSATDDMIVVDGQVVNQGRQTTTAGFGVTKTGTVLIGDNFKVEWDKVKQNDSTAHYAMYAVQSGWTGCRNQGCACRHRGYFPRILCILRLPEIHFARYYGGAATRYHGRLGMLLRCRSAGRIGFVYARRRATDDLFVEDRCVYRTYR